MLKRARLARTVLFALVCVGLLAAPPDARADDFVDRANAPFRLIPRDKRSDLIVLPALKDLEAPPAPFTSQARAALLPSSIPEFEAAAEWAQQESSKKVLAAMKQVTQERDPQRVFAFAQPYGVEGVASEDTSLIEAGLYTELGANPTLAAARIGYMDALEHMGVLAHVEATRLADAGDPGAALVVLRSWTLFARQIADRQFLKEKKWALDSLRLSLERMRDIAFLDMRSGSPRLTEVQIADDVLAWMGERGPLRDARLELPRADVLGIEQIAERVIRPRGDPIREEFGPTLAELDSMSRPLRQFSAAAYWEHIRTEHAGWFATKDMITNVQRDWQKRWELGRFDPLLSTPSDFQRSVATGPRYAMLRIRLSGMEELFPLRRVIECEAAGTRQALAIVAFALKHKNFPPDVTAARRDFLGGAIINDPYSRNPAQFRFFVPIRDTPQQQRKDPRPHTIRLFPGRDLPDFAIDLGQDTFILFSVAPDESSQGCVIATQEAPGVRGDYLLFPPVLSLVRKHLEDRGELR